MATFSTNQTRQIYVATAYNAGVTDASAVGTIGTFKKSAVDEFTTFKYKGVDTIMRSDAFKASEVIYAKATAAAAMGKKLKKYKVVLDPTINSGAPVVGQDYLLRISYRNYVGLSEEDQHTKYGNVRPYINMTASQFYDKLFESLQLNFLKGEDSKTLKFSKEGSGDAVTGIIIEELEQEWSLGTFEQVPVNFVVQPNQILTGGDEQIWGLVTTMPSTTILSNGKNIADLEYFLMGERGDIYRNIGFPNVIKTKYLVDPTKDYNTIDIHYYYTGENESVQKSEKSIIIVVPAEGATNALKNALTNSIITPLNAATGLNIALLPTT